jgi:hypothetical protein
MFAEPRERTLRGKRGCQAPHGTGRHRRPAVQGHYPLLENRGFAGVHSDKQKVFPIRRPNQRRRTNIEHGGFDACGSQPKLRSAGLAHSVRAAAAARTNTVTARARGNGGDWDYSKERPGSETDCCRITFRRVVRRKGAAPVSAGRSTARERSSRRDF